MAAVEGDVDERSTRRRWAWFFGLAAAVVAVDQVTKAWIDATFPLVSLRAAGAGDSGVVPVLGDVVRIAKTYNDGGIFGLFGESAAVLGLASIGVIVLIVVYQARQGRHSALLTLTLGLLLGGAIGNLIDRLRFGHVIDFVDLGIGGVRWYTFNVADAAISGAILLLVLIGLFGGRLERSESRAPSGPERAPLGDVPGATGASN